MDVVEVLRLGREHVASHWTQGVLVSREGETCAVGALAVAACGVSPGSSPRMGVSVCDVPDAALAALAGALPRGVRRYENDSLSSVVEFNDKRGRRQSAVLRLFDRAIAAQS